MIAKTAIAAALISLTTLAAVPAQASDIDIQIGFGGSGYGWSDGNGDGYGQHRHHMRHRVSTDEVRWMLRDRGYHQIRFFDNRGPVYQLSARKHGDMFYLVVSARTGEIIARNRI